VFYYHEHINNETRKLVENTNRQYRQKQTRSYTMKSLPKFSDLQAKLNPFLEPEARKAIVNAYGRFYGLRSKYDGRGNLRTPLKG